ncbi:MAG: 16S rRNA (cytidine(1402)-2'-O)-methyltransferase [Eubacteriales bacterium]|nr:16S rRNA (cytidine(1402)-2'-O)-methyltransferase [Eubacteriales bacterium]
MAYSSEQPETKKERAKAEIGRLYLVPTPIGNLRDLSARAGEVLAEADLVACEDTRVTSRLLAAAGLPFQELISYHSHNEKSRSNLLLEHLLQGENIALVSDAGMPAISDPGEVVVRAALGEGIEVCALPGPNAGLTALSASGLSTRYFYFEGFIPSAGAERSERLAIVIKRPETSIIYEAPHRLEKTLQDLSSLGIGARRLCLGRELTKTYETYMRFTVDEAIADLAEKPARGEYVLILEGCDEYFARLPEAAEADQAAKRAELKAAVASLKDAGLSRKTMVQILIPLYGCRKNEIYTLADELEN